MKKLLLCGAAIAALGWNAPASAQQVSEVERENVDLVFYHEKRQDILVAASRADEILSLDDYIGSASVITLEQLDQRQVRNIAEVLRDVPGVAVSEVAGQTQIRLRGSEANHVLVLVDGIEVSDPFAGEFDIGTLQAEIGSRVEVLRGPQSALYGSDAIGGVVAYESASGRDLDGFSARVEGGTQDTINASARLGAAGDVWDVALSGTIVSTDGQPNARSGTRDIGRDSYTLSGKGAFEATDGLKFRAAARYVQTEGEFNNSESDTTSANFGLIVDSSDVRFENEAVYALIGAQFEALDGDWTHDLSAQIADINRDTFGPSGRTSGSEGDRLKLSYVSAFDIADGHSLTFAADWERERFRNDDPSGFASTDRQQIENIGLVGEYRYSGDRFDFSAALRHDINDRFADETTFRVGAGYRITDSTRLRGSIGSGIKNPGFFELFGFFDGQFIGNEDLQPEKSTGWEVGLDQEFAGGDVRLSATYFDSELENEIFTTFPPPTFIATPANRETDSEQHGVELSANARLGAGFSVDAAYTFLDAEEDGVTEVRRPEDVFSAALNWTHPREIASATLVVRHNGAAEDLAFIDPSFIPVRVTLDDYTLVNLAGEVELFDGVSAFGRIDNLLGNSYEQVFSFVSPGRSAVIGIEARF